VSSANVEVVRSFYATLEGGDLPGGLAPLAPDAVWIETAGHPYGGVYRGPDDVRDAVVGVGTYSATSKATGRPMRARVVHVFRLQDRKIVEFEQFADTHSVREALA
jgi:uncharacterized protein